MRFAEPRSKTPSKKLTLPLSTIGVQTASGQRQPTKIPFGISELDEFFLGGVPVGVLSEWGLPLGRGGRELLVAWLAANPNLLTLWMYGFQDQAVNPVAWFARGANLHQIRFVCSSRPLVDLKPAFMEPLFKVMVIDCPHGITEEECAFIARRARVNNQVTLLLQDKNLAPSKGNIWAKLRVNCYQDVEANLLLEVVRGLSPRKAKFQPAVYRQHWYKG